MTDDGSDDLVEKFADACLAFSCGADLVGTQRLLDRAVDRVHRIERAVGVLEDRLHPATKSKRFLRSELRHVADRRRPRCPHVGSSRPRTICATVDLPEPDSPTMAVVVPRRTVKDTSFTAMKSVVFRGKPPRSLNTLVRCCDDKTRRRSPAGDFGICSASTASATCTACSRISMRSDRELSRCDASDGAAATSFLVYGCCGSLQNLQCRTGFDDLAAIHHHKVLGALGGQAQIVGDEQNRGAEFLGQTVEVVEDLTLHRDVERRGRLVRDQELRTAGQSDGDERALAHTAGELVRVLLQPLVGIGHPGLLEQFGGPLLAALPLAIPLAASASSIWNPIFHTGFRFDIGSCGTKPICCRAARTNSFSDAFVMSLPSK